MQRELSNWKCSEGDCSVEPSMRCGAMREGNIGHQEDGEHCDWWPCQTTTFREPLNEPSLVLNAISMRQVEDTAFSVARARHFPGLVRLSKFCLSLRPFPALLTWGKTRLLLYGGQGNKTFLDGLLNKCQGNA